VEQIQPEREAMADALLQELGAIAESIESEFESAENMQQICKETGYVSIPWSAFYQ
jgi:hypothetical protein